MDIDHQIYFRADLSTDRIDTFDTVFYPSGFDGVIAAVDQFARARRLVGMGVNPHSVAHFAPQQIPDGLLQRLAFNIP